MSLSHASTAQEAHLLTVSNHANEEDRHEQNWHKACAPDSPLNTGVTELRKPFCGWHNVGLIRLAAVDTFISAHVAAMDICQHPSVSRLAANNPSCAELVVHGESRNVA